VAGCRRPRDFASKRRECDFSASVFGPLSIQLLPRQEEKEKPLDDFDVPNVDKSFGNSPPFY
jgi:hypothetical protein